MAYVKGVEHQRPNMYTLLGHGYQSRRRREEDNHTKTLSYWKLGFFKYNCQSLDSTCDKICVGNERFFYFRDYVKIDLYSRFKRRYPIIKK